LSLSKYSGVNGEWASQAYSLLLNEQQSQEKHLDDKAGVLTRTSIILDQCMHCLKLMQSSSLVSKSHLWHGKLVRLHFRCSILELTSQTKLQTGEATPAKYQHSRAILLGRSVNDDKPKRLDSLQ
jgi:hypothetical protein